MRTRTIVTTVSALGLLTVLTACSGGTLAVQAKVNPGSTGANHQPAGVPTSVVATTDNATGAIGAIGATGTPTTKTVPPAVPRSSEPASFTAEVDIQRQDVAMIMLTNTGKHTVTVRGWSNLVFRNAAAEKLPVPTQKVEVPGPGPSISVVPGGSVFAPIEWTAGDKADTSTYVSDDVEVVPPGFSSPVRTKFVGLDGTDPGYYEFDLKSVKIGTFQASTHNLLEF
jgi:hypothetical protein